jgi:hypothetical protein
MTITAKVEKGAIKLPDGVDLPDGTVVKIEPVPELPSESFADGFRDLFGVLKDDRTDLAENHDHYLYGAPKKTR